MQQYGGHEVNVVGDCLDDCPACLREWLEAEIADLLYPVQQQE